MNICFNNLEVRIKDNFCTLVDFSKCNTMYIHTFVPFYRVDELDNLLATSVNDEDTFKEIDKIAIKSPEKILRLQNYKVKEYPVGFFLNHNLNAHLPLVQELES